MKENESSLYHVQQPVSIKRVVTFNTSINREPFTKESSSASCLSTSTPTRHHQKQSNSQRERYENMNQMFTFIAEKESCSILVQKHSKVNIRYDMDQYSSSSFSEYAFSNLLLNSIFHLTVFENIAVLFYNFLQVVLVVKCVVHCQLPNFGVLGSGTL